MAEKTETTQPEPASRKLGQFSLVSIFVLSIVFSSLSLSLGYFFRVLRDNQVAMGQFIVLTAMLPLATLVLANLLFRILRRFGDAR